MRTSRIIAALIALLFATLLHAQASYYWNIFGLDAFTYSNGNLAGNGNWISTASGEVSLSVVSNTIECLSISSSDCSNQYNVTFPNDQCSQVQILTLNVAGGNANAIVTVRSQASGTLNGYYAVAKGPLGASATIQLYKIVSGSVTTLVAPTTETINSGDLIGICAQGTTIYVTVRGTKVTALTATDGSIASGVPGITIDSNGQAATDVILDNWSGFYIGTTVAGGGGGGVAAVKWHPGHYGYSSTYVYKGNTNATQIQNEIALVRAGPSQVLGYMVPMAWNSMEDTTAGTYSFCYLDQIYVQLLTGSTTWTCGTGMPSLSSPRRMGLYMHQESYFNTNPTTEIPTYITSSSTYGPIGPDGIHYGYWTVNGSSGACTGTATATWRPAVMARLIALGEAMATHVLPDGYTVDSSPYIEMVGMVSETAEMQPGNTCGTDSSYSASTALAQAEALDVAMGPIGTGVAFPHTNVQMYNNYLNTQSNTAALTNTFPTSGTAAAGPDTFGYSSGTNVAPPPPCSTGFCGLTWGQAAFVGFAPSGTNPWPSGGTDLRGVVPSMFQAQSTELGYDVTYTPSDIFSQFNTTLKATHAIWTIVPPGTFTGGAINGNWWGSCSSQSTWNAGPSGCGGVLYIITTDPLSQTGCPSSYTGGCNTA